MIQIGNIIVDNRIAFRFGFAELFGRNIRPKHFRFYFPVSVLGRNNLFQPKLIFLARIHCFGQMFISGILAKNTFILPKWPDFCRNKVFRPNIFVSTEYSVSAKIRLFKWFYFGFRCFGFKSLSVAHYYIWTLKVRMQNTISEIGPSVQFLIILFNNVYLGVTLKRHKLLHSEECPSIVRGWDNN